MKTVSGRLATLCPATTLNVYATSSGDRPWLAADVIGGLLTAPISPVEDPEPMLTLT